MAPGFVLVLALLAQADAGPGDAPVAPTLAPVAPVAAPDAGTSPGSGESSALAPLYATCPNAPPVEVLDGGWVLMPPERASRVACLMATCEERRKQQEADAAGAPPNWFLQAAAVVVVVGTAAFAVGWSLGSK